jgi:hypothetical protein
MCVYVLCVLCMWFDALCGCEYLLLGLVGVCVGLGELLLEAAYLLQQVVPLTKHLRTHTQRERGSELGRPFYKAY